MTYAERSLSKDEKIIAQCRPHMISIVPCIFYIIPPLIIIMMIIVFIRNKTTELAITNKRVVGRTGAINVKTLDTPLNKINNVIVETGLGGRIFGYATITVSSSSGVYYFKGLKNADVFRGMLMEQIEQAEEDKMKKQAEEMAKAIKS